MGLAALERRKYEKAWRIPEYSRWSPGVEMLPLFRRMVRPRGTPTLLDIGCGTGRAGVELSKSFDVMLMDFVDAREEAAKKLTFIKRNLWVRPPEHMPTFDYGYCCDVMEHIPPEKVDKVLENITSHCRRVFFSISFTKDHFGQVVGHPLHLTVRPFTWWRDKLGEHGKVRQARDLLGMGAFYVA